MAEERNSEKKCLYDVKRLEMVLYAMSKVVIK